MHPSRLPVSLAWVALAALSPTSDAQEKSAPASVPEPGPDALFVDDPARRPIADAPHAPHATNATVERAAASQVQRAPALAFPIHDVDEHGTRWVRGRDYKASFGVDGATFVPFLGSDAPRNEPVRFAVADVEVGGVDVAFERAVGATLAGGVIAFDRGAFVEEYAIAGGSIEQRFVFDELPARGAVRIAIDVDSDLAGRVEGAGFRFEGERGGVSYGRAIALDGRGARVDVESRLVGGAIELVVPADFVAAAELPLVVDPYVSTFNVQVDTDSDWQSDVAYDAATNAFLIVYEEQFSATDHDVYGRKYVDQVIQGAVVIDVTTVDWRNPKVANNGLDSQFLCVAQAGTSPTRIIRGRTVEAIDLTPGSQFTISGTETGDKTVPDVGGDQALFGPTYYCVVWQRQRTDGDLDVHARLARADGTLFGTGTILLENTTGEDDDVPSVSKTNGLPPFSTQNWNVVWQHDNGTDDDVHAARILWNGSITNAAFPLATTTENERNPAASEPLDDTGNPRYWLASYTIGSDLRLRVMNGAGVVTTNDILANPLGSLGQPTITTDGRKFPFAYTSSFGLFPNIDVDVAAGTLNYIAGQLSYAETTVLASSSTVSETRPEIASTHGATLTNPWRNYVVYDGYNGTDYDVFAAVYDTPANAGGYLYCNGVPELCPCANGNNGANGIAGCASSVNQAGARLDVAGVWSVSQDSTALYCQGMPSTATCLFFQGTGVDLNGTAFGDGLRCAVGTIVRLGTKTSSGGSASYGYPLDTSVSVRGLVPAAGGWRYYQCWYRNSAAFCSPSTFNLSNAAALLWSP